MKTCYKNARIVLPDAVREGCLMTENDTISVRTLSGEQSVEGLSDFIARLQADVKSRKS